ncbi:MAG: hypothetical protein EOP87_22905 [Verrucomicrobiaceae bacterium]|nr:MAG: hypothetical protein EOP87_22905 [Verrucomicrobiaceae bacterium]
MPAAVLFAWSAGLSAMVRDAWHPRIPQWLIGCVIAALIVAVMMLAGRLLRTSPGQRIGQTLAICLLGSVVATAFGGIYLWVAERLGRRREPVTTSLLATGLGITVFGFGIATSMELGHMVSVFAAALAGLLSLRFMFKGVPLGIFRFGALHFLTLFLAMAVASIENEQRKQDRSDSTTASLISKPSALRAGQ